MRVLLSLCVTADNVWFRQSLLNRFRLRVCDRSNGSAVELAGERDHQNVQLETAPQQREESTLVPRRRLEWRRDKLVGDYWRVSQDECSSTSYVRLPTLLVEKMDR